MASNNKNTLSSINNKLLYKYNEKFNQLYKKILYLDDFIINKEELIYKENDEALSKEYTIVLLRTFLYIYLIIILYTGLLKIGIFTFDLYVFLLIITVIYIIYYAYYDYTGIDLKSSFDKNIHTNAVIMKDYVTTNLDDLFPRECPEKCKTKDDDDDDDDDNKNKNKKVNVNNIIPKNGPTLNSSSQINVWKEGDVPDDLFTKPGFNNNIYKDPKKLPDYNYPGNRPRSQFDAPVKSGGTYYQCEWMGGDNSYDLPNKEIDKYSTIPCSFRSNYRENGKFLCPPDINPNNLGYPLGCEEIK